MCNPGFSASEHGLEYHKRQGFLFSVIWDVREKRQTLKRCTVCMPTVRFATKSTESIRQKARIMVVLGTTGDLFCRGAQAQTIYRGAFTIFFHSSLLYCIVKLYQQYCMIRSCQNLCFDYMQLHQLIFIERRSRLNQTWRSIFGASSCLCNIEPRF